MDSVTLADFLSPSQISQFLNCPAKWMFRELSAKVRKAEMGDDSARTYFCEV
jgi:hypothetical protein